VTKLKQAASVIAVLGGLGLLLSSSCGGDSPTAIADNSTGGSAGSLGAGGGAGGAVATGGGAGSSASNDASVGSGGSGVDTDATFFADGMVEIPDGAIQVGDSSLNDEAGDPPLEDAGDTLTDAGVVAKKYGILCSIPGAITRRACTGPATSCCYDSDAPTATCSSRCAVGTGIFRCDGPEDCDVGEVCCGAVSTTLILKGSPNHEYSTSCTRSCGTGLVQANTAYVVICKKAADCGLGRTCQGPATNMPDGLGICSSIRLL